MLGKSSLRKNQSCCRLCLFGALEVSIALGHETYRIYTGYKEGGFYNAWWSTRNLFTRAKRERMSKKYARQLLINLVILRIAPQLKCVSRK